MMSTSSSVHWVYEDFVGTVPEWKTPVDISRIKRWAEGRFGECSVVLLDSGSFNHVYRIDTEDTETSYVLRVSMPLEMPYKVQSEVATMLWVREKTTIPVPKVYAYASDKANAIGYPWILMEYMRGYTMRERWINMTTEAKTALIKRIAGCVSELGDRPLEALGSLSVNVEEGPPGDTPGGGEAKVDVDRTTRDTAANGETDVDNEVEHVFRIGRYTGMDMFEFKAQTPGGPWNHGPYETTHSYLTTRLLQAIERFRSDPEGESELYVKYIEFLHEMIRMVDHKFDPTPPCSTATTTAGPESRFILFMADLHPKNILVDEDGALLAIIDWELTTTRPVWHAAFDAEEPKFLVGRLYEEPETHWEDGSVNEDYEEEVFEFDMGMVYQDVYREELDRLQPGWEEMRQSFSMEGYVRTFVAAGVAGTADYESEHKQRFVESFWRKVEEKKIVPR